MLYTKLVVALACATLASATPRALLRHVPRFPQAVAAPAAGNNSQLILNPANIQSGSTQDGLQASGVKPGNAPAATDAANFINFCTGKTLTNGNQVKTGSCNGIVMGDIPANTNMISSIIVSPGPGEVLQSATTFNVSVQMTGLVAGSFVNAASNYYSSPQQLSGGNVVGHTHVTIQDMGGSLTPSNAPDPGVFAFFKGIDNAGNGQGLLSVTVTGGLAPGFYRVCTMASSSNHQPVLMPVAQRGAQDDCQKIQVADSGIVASSTATGAAATTTAAVVGTTTTAAVVDTTTTAAAAGTTTTAAVVASGTTTAAVVATTASSAAAVTTTAAAGNGGGNGGGHHGHGGHHGGNVGHHGGNVGHHGGNKGGNGGGDKKPVFCGRDAIYDDED